MHHQPINARREAVEQFAETLLADHGVTRAPVDIDAVAARVGVRFELADVGTLGAYFGVIRPGLPAIAFVSSRQSAARRRYTKGHELAHDLIDGRMRWSDAAMAFVLAERNPKALIVLPRRYRKGLTFHLVHEYFAASLLMPRSMVARLVESIGVTTPRRRLIAVVMRTFRVSAVAAMLRLD
jgi:Zn-dependent peptidase ImmA (M78 family)